MADHPGILLLSPVDGLAEQLFIKSIVHVLKFLDHAFCCWRQHFLQCFDSVMRQCFFFQQNYSYIKMIICKITYQKSLFIAPSNENHVSNFVIYFEKVQY